MNKKGNGVKFLIGTVLILLLGIVVVGIILRGQKAIKNEYSCPATNCFEQSKGCPVDDDDPFVPKLDLECASKELKCCCPASDPTCKIAAGREKSTDPVVSTSKDQKVIKQVGTISARLNDDPLLLTDPNIVMVVGEKNTISVLAQGENSENCMINILDSSKRQVKAEWMTGQEAGKQFNCQEAKTITFEPNAWSLGGETYKLVITLASSPTAIPTKSLSYNIVFKTPDEPVNSVIVS